jgi:hypothetical protein
MFLSFKDFEFLSDGLEGRTRNPVSLLFDHLTHPDVDLGARLQSKLKWRYDKATIVDHLCLGRTDIGGVWSRLTSKYLQTASIADCLDLPNYTMANFRQDSRVSHCTTSSKQSARATYDEVRSYYVHYVKRNRLSKYFRSHCHVTSIERVYRAQTNDMSTSDYVWQIRGYDELNETCFSVQARYVVLATGVSQDITRPLGICHEQASQLLTYTNVSDIEDLIVQRKLLTSQSKPLLIIGCGLAAIDVLLLCQRYSIPVLHVFRRSIDDQELEINQLTGTIYSDYEHIRELIRQTLPNAVSQIEFIGKKTTAHGTMNVR